MIFSKIILENKRFLLSRVDNLGDFLLSIPSFFMLKQMYPEAYLVILARGQNCELAKKLPYVDKVLNYEDADIKEQVRDARIDVFLNLGLLSGKTASDISQLARNSGASIRGSRFKFNLIGSYNLFSFKSLFCKSCNEAELSLALLEKLDNKLFRDNFKINTAIFYDEKFRAETSKYFTKEKNVVIHPFSRNSSANLSPQDYASLIKAIRRDTPDVGLIISAGANEANQLDDLKKMIGEEDAGVIYFCNREGIFHLIALIDQADIYIGGSTGPTHIAGALQKAIVALYPQRPVKLSKSRWGVFNNDKVFYPVFDEDFSGSSRDELRYFKSYDTKHELEILNYIKHWL